MFPSSYLCKLNQIYYTEFVDLNEKRFYKEDGETDIHVDIIS